MLSRSSRSRFLKRIWIWIQRFFNLNWQLKVDDRKKSSGLQLTTLQMYRMDMLRASQENFTCQVLRFPPRSKQWEHLYESFTCNVSHVTYGKLMGSVYNSITLCIVWSSTNRLLNEYISFPQWDDDALLASVVHQLSYDIWINMPKLCVT